MLAPGSWYFQQKFKAARKQNKKMSFKEEDFFEEFLAEGRGLHSFTSQLNLSVFYGIGGARGGCAARIKGVLGDV